MSIPKLSFAEEEEEEEVFSGIQSSHDLLTDPSFSKDQFQPKVLQENPQKEEKTSLESHSDEEDFDTKMRNSVLQKKKNLDSSLLEMDPTRFGKFTIVQEDQLTRAVKDPEEEFQQLKNQLLIKRNPTGTNNPYIQEEIKQEETLLSPLELRRFKYNQHRKKTKGREAQTLQKLDSFIQNLKSNQTQKKWFNNKLKFSVDSSRAYSYKSENALKEQGDPTKRLKRFQEQNDIYSKESLQDVLSFESLKQLTDPKNM